MTHLYYLNNFETRKHWWPILAAIGKAAVATGKGVAAIKSIGGGDSSDRSNTNLLDSQMGKIMNQDTGFYGHNKVPDAKQDTSGFYKHQKKVGQTLF